MLAHLFLSWLRFIEDALRLKPDLRLKPSLGRSVERSALFWCYALEGPVTAADQAVQTRHLSFNTDVHGPLHVADEDAILYKLLHLFKGQ